MTKEEQIKAIEDRISEEVSLGAGNYDKRVSIEKLSKLLYEILTK